MSIKKINFLRDFSGLSRWGHNKIPFFAVVDFAGNLAAAPLEAPFLLSAGGFRGRISLGDSVLHFRFNAASPNPATSSRPLEIAAPPPEVQVTQAIRQLQHELGEGYSYLVNFCSQTGIRLNTSPQALFEASAAPFTVWLENEFIAFSPEAFVRIAGNEITTTPMKGTGYDAAALLADAKEQAEHATIVDLLRNDLGRGAGDIRIANYRFVGEIPQADGRVLYQTSSEIRGKMAPDWQSRIGDWLPQLLPAGSITGAPKMKTVELIRKYETEARGFFTGIAALFDGMNFYSCVLIRYLDLAGPTLKFRSGAGITIYSDPEAEYREILSKVYIPV
ncbi:MAG: aminodeoxychorismate synthase component I [Spirochaetes bacterium]|nr:aminodeoxychorismate synthase component I [Spirochaetota bacterium]